jgi:hypothetical protein
LAALGFGNQIEPEEDIRLIGSKHIDGSKDLEPGFILVINVYGDQETTLVMIRLTAPAGAVVLCVTPNG